MEKKEIEKERKKNDSLNEMNERMGELRRIEENERKTESMEL